MDKFENYQISSVHVVPIGFNFKPTDEQLVSFFLFNKAMDFPLPNYYPYVIERDLYGDNSSPFDIFNIDSSTDDQTVYVFTRLSKVKNGKTHVARTAGNGTWEGETDPKDITGLNGELIGSKKMLSYKDRDKRSSCVSWTMHEISLAGVSLEQGLKHKDYVICRIKRKYKVEPSYRRDENTRLTHQESVFVNQEPVFGDQESVFGYQEPIFGYQEPIFGDREPIFGDREPIFGDREPVFVNQETIFGDQEPIFGDQESVFGDQEPVFVNQEPIFVNQEPFFGDEEPIFGDREPFFVNREPIFGDREPVVDDQESTNAELANRFGLF